MTGQRVKGWEITVGGGPLETTFSGVPDPEIQTP